MKNPLTKAEWQSVRESVEGGTGFICHAIDSRIFPERAEMGRAYIHRLLNGYETYVGWLEAHHKDALKRMGDTELRQGRLQWLDHLIAEAEE